MNTRKEHEESFKYNLLITNEEKIDLINKLIILFIIIGFISLLFTIFFIIYFQKTIFIISFILFLLSLLSLIIILIIKYRTKKRITIVKNNEEENEEENEDLSKNTEKEETILQIEKIEKINKRQFDFNNEIKKEEKNENILLIEKRGKLRGLSNDEIEKETKRAQLLEDMSVMGTIMKNQILKEKEVNPEKFISTEEIIQKESNDSQLYALGIFSKALQDQGMTTAIERNEDESDENAKKIAQTSLQFLVNGMSEKNKYNLHFEFGKEKNKLLLNEKEERKIFHDKLRKKLAEEFNINEEEIILTFPRKGSYQVTVIFKSHYFELKEEELLKKFNNEKGELGKLKKIEKGILLDGCILRPSMLDYRGNNQDGGWAGIGEKRGGEEYIPPIGWIGYGLKVLDVYNDNNWLGMNNTEGEWCVAYHGVACGQESKQVSHITGLIYKSGFKPSICGKATYDDDLRHPGKKCGLGVYCSPDISYAEIYAGEIEFNEKKYKCVLMLRVNPKKIRQSKSYPKEYLLEPDINEIRPYRILLKEV